MRRYLLGLCASLLASTALAQTTDPAAPKGRLPAVAAPSAYRLDMTILPDQPGFSGHTEIEATLRAPIQRLYIHGKDLKVARAAAVVGGRAVPATWTQVDPTGVARLDFAQPLPAGAATLVFDYQAGFRDNPSGMYRIKVGEQWYSWTQFESIDARAAFPSFDEPGFKTPFTISVTTRPGFKVVSNAPETGVAPASGGLEVHRFAPTRPLPTYLVAIDTGPFLHPPSAVPPDAHRSAPLPLGAVATQAQAGKLDYVLKETPRIVGLLEDYFGQPFPFPKLDQVASPTMPGAMENAGADTYADEIILLDPGATTGQKQTFGMVVSHELAHQWFGDLVTPAWWDDIWLNESFANWMGFKIGNAWRPELNIGVNALAEGLAAMNTDALEAGRPIHQAITTNGEIDSAFDSITYGKGGQVIAMVASYMGDQRFQAGVRLHLSRHMYGNATTDDFFRSLADAGRDPRIVAAMRSFVDQPGVPLVTFSRTGGRLTATQSRYAFLGSAPKPQAWTVPLCVRTSATRNCSLLEGRPISFTAPAGRWVMPNAGGAGYYRFDLPAVDWRTLIGALPSLPAGEALAADDSLWASFRAGRAGPAMLVAEARTLTAHPDSNVSVSPGARLSGLRTRGVIDEAGAGDYRRLMGQVYAPKLASLGLDPTAGAYAAEPPDRQKQRQELAELVAQEANDPVASAKLTAAARAYLGGNARALDQGFMRLAFTTLVREEGVPAARALADRALASEDAVFRGAALGALSRSGRTDVAQWALGFTDKRLRSTERISLVTGLSGRNETRDMAADYILANYDTLAASAGGIFGRGRVQQGLSTQCSVERAAQIDSQIGPKVRGSGVGVLDFERLVEQIRHCGDLKRAREGELAAALRAG